MSGNENNQQSVLSLKMKAFLEKPTLADGTAEPSKAIISCIGSILDHLLFGAIVCEVEGHLMLSGKTEANRFDLCFRDVQHYVPAMWRVSLELS